MSLVSCSFPLSLSGFAIETCSTNVLITCVTIATTLLCNSTQHRGTLESRAAREQAAGLTSRGRRGRR